MKRGVTTTTGLAGSTSAEFVVATLPGVALTAEPGGVLLSHVVIDGYVNITPNGTTITSVVLRVRRTNLSGAVVGQPVTITTVAPGVASSLPIMADDPLIQATPPTIPGQIYVVTAVQAGTVLTAPTVNYAVVTATVS